MGKHPQRLAFELLCTYPELLEDAQCGGRLWGNTVVGALLTRPLGPCESRDAAEEAVRYARVLLERNLFHGLGAQVSPGTPT